MSRIERALQQRMYLLSATRTTDLTWLFVIEGSRGIPYRIQMNIFESKCSCPDYRRSRLCKHIMFISLRVLKSSEIHLTVNETIDLKLQKILTQQQHPEGATTSELTDVDTKEKRKSIVGESCPICFEEYESENDDSSCSFCRTCSNPIHKTCLSIWLKQKLNCPLCRSVWTITLGREEEGEEEGDELVKFSMKASFLDSDPTVITSQQVRSQYGLREADLKKIECDLRENPNFPSAKPIRLYHIATVEQYIRNKKVEEEKKRIEKEEQVAARKKAKSEEQARKKKAKIEREERKQPKTTTSSSSSSSQTIVTRSSSKKTKQ